MLVGVGRALAWLSPRASRGGHAHTGEAARAPESGAPLWPCVHVAWGATWSWRRVGRATRRLVMTSVESGCGPECGNDN